MQPSFFIEIAGTIGGAIYLAKKPTKLSKILYFDKSINPTLRLVKK
jgi:hypothetical protein